MQISLAGWEGLAISPDDVNALDGTVTRSDFPSKAGWRARADRTLTVFYMTVFYIREREGLFACRSRWSGRAVTGQML
jgi:hypothetical protein